MLIYSAGLRVGEALALKLHDVRSAEGLLYLREAKGTKDRRVPVFDKALEVLGTYYDSYQPKTYLFEGVREGTPYSQSSARKVLKRALQKAGIKRKIVLHSLRDYVTISCSI